MKRVGQSYILYITNILLYILLLSVFIIIYKYIIYMQIFNSVNFLLYFYIVGFIEDKDEEGGTEDEGQKEEDGQGELDVNLLLHLAKDQWLLPC